MRARLWGGALPSDGHLHISADVSTYVLSSRLNELQAKEQRKVQVCTVSTAFDMQLTATL